MEVVKMVPLNDYTSLKMEVDRLNNLVYELSDKLSKMEGRENQESGSKTIFIKSKGIGRFVKVNDIIMIKAESNYSLIYLINSETIFTSKTLKFWQDKCNESYIKRVHKSYLINASYIDSIENKTGKINMANGLSASTSRNTRILKKGELA